ncbi:MAG: SelT/SelW/SelH family protein [Phycisphaerales bacterium]|nr:SelT/SelW/SelH family protein [Phycisphaerales bacterium]
MAEAIKKKHGIGVTMIEGRGGIFDVRVDGSLVYSKQQTGQFPEHAEILDKLATVAK